MASASGPAPSDAPQTLAVVVMGVAGAGKTTVGLRLAEGLRGQFIDGDDLHTEEARAKMSHGQPLTDDDRWPWFDRVAAALSDGVSHGVTTVVASSALRRVYRDWRASAPAPACASFISKRIGVDARPGRRPPRPLYAGFGCR